ncbi:MAG: SCO family protein [Betaproteobacteria bacterium]|nr:SCO family protein [Betaproteobacteria bacterium]
MRFLLPLLALLACIATSPARAADDEPPPVGITPRYLLMDPNGRAVTQEDFAGRFQLIAFGFTACPDICPTTLLQVKAVLEGLGAQARRLQPIFITVDPERDTPAVLREYTAAFHPRILGLSGSPDLVRAAAMRFKVHYEKVFEPGAPPEHYTMDHTAGMYLLGPDGGFLAKFAHAAAPEEVTQRILTFMAEAPAGRGERGGRRH